MKKENSIILSYNANIHTHKLKRIVGYYYKEYVESLPKPQYKYKVICNHCQKAWYYQKRTKVINSIFKNPNSCTCPHCRQRNFSIVNL